MCGLESPLKISCVTVMRGLLRSPPPLLPRALVALCDRWCFLFRLILPFLSFAPASPPARASLPVSLFSDRPLLFCNTCQKGFSLPHKGTLAKLNPVVECPLCNFQVHVPKEETVLIKAKINSPSQILQKQRNKTNKTGQNIAKQPKNMDRTWR